MTRCALVLVVVVLAGCSSPAPSESTIAPEGVSRKDPAKPDGKTPEAIALERENARLKNELAEAKGQQAPNPPNEKPEAVKTTLNGIEYEFVEIVRNGNLAVLRLAVTAKNSDALLVSQMKIHVISTDGTQHDSAMGSSGGKQPKLLHNVRKVIDFDLGKLPANMTEITTIILPGKGGSGFRAAAQNPVLLKGNFKVQP